MLSFMAIRRRLLAAWWVLSSDGYFLVARNGDVVSYAVTGRFEAGDVDVVLEELAAAEGVQALLDAAAGPLDERSGVR